MNNANMNSNNTINNVSIFNENDAINSVFTE